ncbi:4794_t:CDS:2 [Ambispora leptoticha]|uniref:4794_t:CDS:1 n=1 Tax=Ambispora leptoticha TaxID=144679 RepID=A0A9N9FA94_9GLOM|nr:4794_t:CDS:2 [Ambispora leptoticha]
MNTLPNGNHIGGNYASYRSSPVRVSSRRITSRRAFANSHHNSLKGNNSRVVATRQSSIDSSIDGKAIRSRRFFSNGPFTNRGSAIEGTSEKSIISEESNSENYDIEEKNWKEERKIRERRLAEIKVEHNAIKKRFFEAKEKDLDKEKDDILHFLHPELVRLNEKKDEDRQRREVNAERRRKLRDEAIEINFEAQISHSTGQYMDKRRALRKSMLQEMLSKKNRLIYEYSQSKLKSKEMTSIDEKEETIIRKMEDDVSPESLEEQQQEEDLRLIRESIQSNMMLMTNPTPKPTTPSISTPISTLSNSQSTRSIVSNSTQNQSARDYPGRENSEIPIMLNKNISIVNAWLATEEGYESDKDNNSHQQNLSAK